MSSKIAKLKSLVSGAGIARSYNWQINIPAVPDLLSSVVAQPLASNLDLYCKECPLPAKVVEPILISLKTQKWQINGLATNEGTMSPTFIIDGNWDIYKLFRMWADLGASAREDKQLNETELQVPIYVQALNGSGEVVMSLKVEDVWVSECPEQTGNSESGAMDALNPVFAFSRSYILGIDNPIDSL